MDKNRYVSILMIAILIENVYQMILGLNFNINRNIPIFIQSILNILTHWFLYIRHTLFGSKLYLYNKHTLLCYLSTSKPSQEARLRGKAAAHRAVCAQGLDTSSREIILDVSQLVSNSVSRLSVSQSGSQSVWLSVNQSVSLSVSLSVCLSVT